MQIQINGRNLPCSIVRSGDRMSIAVMGETSVREIYNAFLPETMPDVTILNDEGGVEAVYINHRITSVHWSDANVQVDLQVDPLERTEARTLSARMDEQEAGSAVDEGAIEELAGLMAELSERVSTLEGGE